MKATTAGVNDLIWRRQAMGWVLLVFCLYGLPARGQYRLSGQVRAAGTGGVVVAANVVVPAAGKGTLTDPEGSYQLLLPAGRYQVSFSSVGYQTQIHTLTLGQDTRLDIALQENSKQMEEVTVTGRTEGQHVKSLQMSHIQLDLLQIRKVPVVFGESDVLKALTLQPGIATVGEGAGGFHVRGGRSDQNLILLDGAPLFNSSHLLGFFTSVSPDAIRDVALYKGGLPAAYGGRLSSLLTLNLRPGHAQEHRISGGVSPISSRLLVEGPLLRDKVTFLAGGRLAYPNWILRSFPGNTKKSRAFFYDGNVKIQYQLNDKHTTSLTAYRSYDDFKFPADTVYSWQSNLVSWRWHSQFSPALSLSVQALHSDYGFATEGGNPDYGFVLRSTIRHREVKADLLFSPSRRHKTELGGSVIGYNGSPGALKPTGASSSINPLTLSRSYGLEQAAYLSHEWALLPELSLQAGLRYSAFQLRGPGQVYRYEAGQPRSAETLTDTTRFSRGDILKSYGGWEPRLALRLGLGPKTALKGHYQRTRQYLHLITNTTAISPVDFWKLSDAYVPPQVADQVGLGLVRSFRDNGWEATLEGFYKDLQSLVEYKDGATLLLNPHLETELLPGKGRAYGVEGSLHKLKGRFTGQAAYTYSRSWVALQTPYAQEQVNNGSYFPASFDRPHNLALTGGWDLRKGWTLASNFVYTSGRPATYPDGKYLFNGVPVVHYSRRNADRIPDYHRLDVSFTKDTRRTKDQPSYQLWVVSLYNVYARKNPYSIYFTSDQSVTRSYRLAVFGALIPSLTWNFYF